MCSFLRCTLSGGDGDDPHLEYAAKAAVMGLNGSNSALKREMNCDFFQSSLSGDEIDIENSVGRRSEVQFWSVQITAGPAIPLDTTLTLHGFPPFF